MSGASSIDKTDVKYYDVKEAPFELYGFYEPKSEGFFKRMPDDVAEATSASVASLYKCTAGGRLRFSTDSDYVVIRVKLPRIHKFIHMALMASAGFDLFIDDVTSGRSIFYDIFKFSTSVVDNYTAIVRFPDRSLRHLTINFPLYGEVSELLVGLAEGAYIGEGAKYRNKKPVVYYGSSITHGACATRPGSCYPAILSRRLNIDYLNLGFSGSCKAEDAIVEYMSNLDMSVFVCDYDHNAPTVEYLRETHHKVYDAVRAKNPELPIIFISRPDFSKHLDNSIRRREIILDTYHKAYNSGDRNVYFIDGESFCTGDYEDCCFSDDTHPTDLGFVKMAESIGNVLGKLKIE